ncbi:hypothetical protein TKK_0011306 [Trichogramma kaykai]
MIKTWTHDRTKRFFYFSSTDWLYNPMNYFEEPTPNQIGLVFDESSAMQAKVWRSNGRKGEPKNFPCPNCSSGFTYEKGLNQHIKYECGQKPRYKCPYCHYASKWMNNIYKHVRNKHEGAEVRYVLND